MNIVRLCIGSFVALAGIAHAQEKHSSQTVLGVPCSEIFERGIDKQENLRATMIRIGCGLDAPGQAETEGATGINAIDADNINLITGGEVFPHVTQSESMVWSTPDAQTIVVNYNDSNTAPANYSGVSVSFDGGITFARLLPAPFATGHGTNYGDPILVFDNALNKWFAGDLATGCGGQGLGLWTSDDAMTWTVGACAHSGSSDDRPSMWVDNNAASPFYGRMYISWNDFARGQNIFVVYSDDGTTWSTPVQVNTGSTFVRDVQLTGSLGDDGTVFIAGMDEGGGGVNNRVNIMYRSLDGGAHWTAITMGPSFPPPGQPICGYFAAIIPIWRHMGWGQPAVGPGGVVHYAYAARGTNPGDLGDILYTRSDDNGDTWSSPITLNTDAAEGGSRAQWMPSLSVTADGSVIATWYDRRNTIDNSYEYWMIQSADNGQSWGPDQAISDIVSPQPEQPDPTVQACYAGDYNYQTAIGGKAWATWTEGRNLISGHFQQDVYFAALDSGVSGLGTLQGTVSDSGTGNPIPGARVGAVGPVNRFVTTNRDGFYRMRLPAGIYDVGASPFGYLPCSVPGVEIIEGQTTVLDLSCAFGPAHRVSGTIVSSINLQPVANATVRVLNTPIPTATTDSNGMYSFPSVPDGSYDLQVSPPVGVRCLSAQTRSIVVDQDLTVDFALEARTDAFGYACDDTIVFNWTPGTFQTSLEGDEATLPVDLPFPFTFYGQTYTVIYLSTNGFGNFLEPRTDPFNACIPNPALPNALTAPFWTDLWINRPGGPADSHVYTALLGDPGSQQFVIEYRNATFFGQPFTNVATFEMVLSESDNSITYQYNRTDGLGTGQGATVGIEDEAGAIGLQFSCREPVLSVGKAIRFFLRTR
jgi:hypothetical protein